MDMTHKLKVPNSKELEQVVDSVKRKIPYEMYLSSEKWSNYYFKNGPLFFAI